MEIENPNMIDIVYGKPVLFLDGGNWQNGSYAGDFTLKYPYRFREIFVITKRDIDGLPERWVKIMKREVLWGNTKRMW